MNIRFAKDEIRYRVTEDEFQQILQGGYVQLETIPLTFVAQMAKKPLEQAMVIDLSCSAVQLVISPEEMESFKAQLPSKRGIEKTLTLGMGKSINVAFEVDLRS